MTTRHLVSIAGGAAVAAVLMGAAAGADDRVPHEVVDGTSIPAPLTGEPGDPARGREVVVGRRIGHCLACHAIPVLGDEPFHGTVGPSLAGVAGRYTEGELRLRVVDPKAVNPDSIMPAFYRRDGLYRVAEEFEGGTILTAQQVEDVVAFLLTLTDGEPSPADQVAPTGDPLEELRRVAIPAPEGSPYPWLFSGYHTAGERIRAVQDDDASNPAFFAVQYGSELWAQADGERANACKGCHGDATASMRGVGARYPVYHEPWGKLINLEQRINLCRTEHMAAEPWEWGSRELVAMTTFVRHQSRGMPVNVSTEGAARPFFEQGERFYYRRRGLFDMSCAQCHETYYGERLRGNLLSQGHTNAHPIYFMNTPGMEFLHELFELCNKRVRSEPYPYGSEEYVNLELYTAWRGQGLPVETPGVR